MFRFQLTPVPRGVQQSHARDALWVQSGVAVPNRSLQICKPVNPPKVSLVETFPSVVNGPTVVVVLVVVTHVSTPVA